MKAPNSDDDDKLPQRDPDRDYLFDPSGVRASSDPAKVEVETLEEKLRGLRYSPTDALSRVRQAKAHQRVVGDDDRGPAATSRKVTVLVIGAFAVAAALFAIVRGKQVWPSAPSATMASAPPVASSGTKGEAVAQSFAVARIAGAPKIGGKVLGDAGGRLEVGAWLETDEASRAAVTLSGIGAVHVDPRSRLRLVSVTQTQQRLELTQGAIEAKVVAPPRLFIVDTPAARATDLGCAYRLEVMPDGGGLLHVTSGVVELEGHGRSAWVPAGALCETLPNKGPSAPYFADALDAFKDALHRLESDDTNADDPPPGLMEELVSAARPHDTLTLWHLKARLHGKPNEIVTGRIHALVPAAKDAGSIEDLVTHW